MEKRTWYCDVEGCKKEVGEEDLVHLSVIAIKRGFNKQEKKIDVCQECALKVGILKLTEEDEKAKITQADELYSIFSDMVYDQISNQ